MNTKTNSFRTFGVCVRWVVMGFWHVLKARLFWTAFVYTYYTKSIFNSLLNCFYHFYHIIIIIIIIIIIRMTLLCTPYVMWTFVMYYKSLQIYSTLQILASHVVCIRCRSNHNYKANTKTAGCKKNSSWTTSHKHLALQCLTLIRQRQRHRRTVVKSSRLPVWHQHGLVVRSHQHRRWWRRHSWTIIEPSRWGGLPSQPLESTLHQEATSWQQRSVWHPTSPTLVQTSAFNHELKRFLLRSYST